MRGVFFVPFFVPIGEEKFYSIIAISSPPHDNATHLLHNSAAAIFLFYGGRWTYIVDTRAIGKEQ